MSDGMIHIPAKKRKPVKDPSPVKLTPEAYNVLVDICNESTLSLKQVASIIIVNSVDRIVFDREE